MKRPIDPRHHGLREPERLHTKVETISLTSATNIYWKKQPLSLLTVVKAWEKALSDHQSIGQRVVKEPVINDHLDLVYTIGWDNENYTAELADYNRQIAQYEVEMANFLTFEELKATLPTEHPQAIEMKIERTKQRLANLEAMRDKKPLPFP